MDLKYLICVLVILKCGESARILAIFQVPSFSHQCVFQPIWKELALRGHELVVVTSHPLKDPTIKNLTEIDISYTKDIFLRHGFQYAMSKSKPTTDKIQFIFKLNYELSEAVFEDAEFRKIYENPDEKFDLVMVQMFINPIFLSLGVRFKAPVVGVSSMGAYIGTHFAIGNPHHPALYSDMFLPYHGKLSFMERWYSTFYYLWVRAYLHFSAIPRCDQIARKYLGSDIPSLDDLHKNLSLLFLNTNPILYEPRANIPTIIEISQLHIKPTKTLPQDLQDELDKAKKGVIYFSLGSNIQSVNIPVRFRNVLIETFAELPYTILWKWESDHLPNKPKNVITRKWLSQQDVLAHPNIKAFITQCGLQSLEESFRAGVPIVGVPFIGDQEMNIKRLSAYGVGVGVDYLTVTKEELKAAILEVAENDKYRKKSRMLNELLNDHPQTSLERVVWWTEYVIRHNGTTHLRSPTVDISWFHFLLLDVVGVTLTIVVVIVYVIVCIIRLLFCMKTKKLKHN